jgi:imidazole glycerol-phosphate synthase subunit HisH
MSTPGRPKGEHRSAQYEGTPVSRPSIAVVDYGVGNLYSVRRALEHCGATVTLAATGADVQAADRLLLPGVGAFADGMAGLRSRGLIEPIQRFARTGKPLLGICLGMQMLASVGEEFGEHDGLGLIPGRVVPIPRIGTDGLPRKIPHVGWSALGAPAGVDWAGTLLEGSAQGTAVYLVHSYRVVPDDPAQVLAQCDYGGHSVVAALRSGNVTGCQFHPEKSGPAGLAILARFIHL